MNKNGSLYYLGVGIISVGLVELIMMFFALLMRDSASVFAFGGGVILSCFTGSALVLATKGEHERLGRIDQILLLLYLWMIIPIFAAIPFYNFMGGFIKAYVEAVSALTTTGATAIEYNRYIPKSLYFWRNILAWSGGLLSITMILSVLAPSGAGGLEDRSSKYLGAKYSETHNFKPILIMVGTAYGLITIILTVALMISGAKPFDALNLILSTISTTGFHNIAAGGFGYYDNYLTELIVMISMFMGSALIIVFFRQFVNHKSRLNFNIEVKLFIIICLTYAFCITLYLMIKNQNNLLEIGKIYFNAVFDSVSILSTTAIINDTEWQPITFYYILAFIGGASFTTAGGMKLFRFLVFLRYSKIEVGQLAYPNSVASIRYLGMRLDVKYMRLIWSFFIAYAFLTVVMAIIISSFGHDINTSLLNAIGSVANIGPLADFMLAKGQDVIGFSQLDAKLQLILCFGMILGRLEVISVLGLLNIAYWKNR